jgi:GNAT superfamily N-acetyltransferase
MTPGAAGVTVRPAVGADVERMVELLGYGALPPVAPDPAQPVDLAAPRRAWAEIDAGPGALLVAELGGEVVGVCQLIVFRHFQSGGGLCAELESVHVHPDRRGHGIGRLLIAAAVDRARALGCYRVQLTSNVARTEAHHFYGSLGFTPSHVGFKMLLG